MVVCAEYMAQQTNPHLTRLADAAAAAAEAPGRITPKDPAINFVGTVPKAKTDELFTAASDILHAHGAEAVEVRFVPYETNPERVDVQVLWGGREKKA